MTAARVLGEFAARLTAGAVPAEVAERMRAHVLVNLACGMAAEAPAGVDALLRGGGPAEAGIVGRAARAPAETAALINGAQAGARGAATALEGRAGLAAAFAGSGVPDRWELGRRRRTLELIYKPYAVCNITQAPVMLAATCFLTPRSRTGPRGSSGCRQPSLRWPSPLS